MRTLRELVDDMASICGNATSQWLVERALVFDHRTPPSPTERASWGRNRRAPPA